MPRADPIVAELAALRRAAGLFQRQIAEQIGHDPQTVLRWEKGWGVARLDAVHAYARIVDRALVVVSAVETGESPRPNRRIPGPLRGQATDDPIIADLTRRRREAGIGQVELAARMGYSRNTVWQWETGRATPTIDTVAGYAHVLGHRLALAELQPPAGRSAPEVDVARRHPIVAELTALRRRDSITQDQIVERTGHNRKTLSLWETGHRAPRLDAVKAYAKALDRSLVLIPEGPDRARISGRRTAPSPRELDNADPLIVELATLRLDRCLSQDELADEIGYGGASVSAWENARAVPSVCAVDAYARALGRRLALAPARRRR